MTATERLERAARAVDCPACRARPEFPCTQPTNTGRRDVTWVHLERVSVLEREQRPTTYLDLAAIAERAGVEYESMRTYHKRAERNRAADIERPGDLPAPDIRLGRTPGWSEDTINRWIDSRPRAGARA